MSDSKKYEYDDDTERLGLRDDIGHAGNIRLLIRLCYRAADDEYLFANRVDLLRRSLPVAIKESDEYQDKLEECTTDLPPTWEYSRFGGARVGTPEKPVCGSPWKVPGGTFTDWQDVFELCVDFLERENITWKKDESFGAV